MVTLTPIFMDMAICGFNSFSVSLSRVFLGSCVVHGGVELVSLGDRSFCLSLQSAWGLRHVLPQQLSA